MLALAWQLYAMRLNNPLLVPTFAATVEAFWGAIATGGLLTVSTGPTAGGVGTVALTNLGVAI